MSVWGKRQDRFNRRPAHLRFEQLERRELLSAIPITSGNSVTFFDGDGTKVVVKLTGPGSGSLTLTNGQLSGGWIDSMTISGTGATSQLKITASGGQDSVSTVRLLTVTPASPGTALAALNTTAINVAAGGLLTFNGSVGSMSLNNVNHGASVVVNGSLQSYIGAAFHSNSTLDVQSTLGSINVKTFGNGGAQANLTAQTLTKLTVSQLVNSAVIQVGSGGVSSAFIQASQNAALSSAGNIGTVVVQGAASNTGIAANRSPGSDGILGTLDDYTINSSATPTITSVQFNGAVSAAGYGVQVITTSSTTPPVTGTGGANVESVDNAMSTYIPLQIEQATAGITGFDDDEIWIAVYGQEISTETNPPANPLSYYLDALNLSGSGATAAPIPISTTTLVVDPNTPNQAILPSYTLAQWKNVAKTWGSNLQFPVPAIGNEYTGRILISVGAPVQAQVTTASPYTVAAPTPASAIDASNGTFYDFLEFTVSNLTPAKGGLTLDMDTSQVDSFGLPMQLQFFQDTAGTQPYNVAFQGTVTPGNASITGVTNVSLLKTGQPIVGSGIEPGSLISQINGTTIVLNKAATSANPATPVLTSLTAQNAGPVGVQITRQDVIDPANADSLMSFLQTQLTNDHDNARPFLQTAAPYQTSGPVPIVGAQATNGGSITIYTNSTAGLNVNDQVAIYGVGGITNANGLYTVGAVDHGANTFTLLNSSGNGTYTQGGVWQIAITGATVGAGPDYEITISTTNVSGLNVGDIIQIVNVSGMTSANGFFIVAAINANTFTLEGSNGQGQTFTLGPQGPGTLAGTWSVYTNGPRVVAPDDIVSQLPAHTSPNGLNNYFNELIDEFFLTYLPSSQTVVGGDGISRTGGGATLSVTTTAGGANYAGTYSGTVQNLGTGTNQGYALVLTNSTLAKTFVIYYPFSTANAPSPNIYLPKFPLNAPQTWQVQNQLQFTSGSEMVFGCTGVFADNVFRAKAFNKDGNWSAVLGDLENSVASAFNRGIALNDSTTWSDSSHWFQQTAAPLTPSRPSPSQASELYGVYNYWVEYWHQNGIAINDLAYAYPYDDKYGASTNMQVENVGLAQVLLNQWSTTQNISTTTVFGDATTIPVTAPVSPANPAQGSQVTLTATVAANSGGVTPTGTLTFFIDGVPINSNNFSDAPPQQPVALTPTATSGVAVASITATLPALPDGSLTRTYTVTSVYSGDATNAPSIAYTPLQLTGVNGDFLITPAPGATIAGSTISVSGTLPGGVYNGTLAFSVGGTTFATINVGSENFHANIALPAGLSAGLQQITGLYTPLSGGPYTGLFDVMINS